MFRKRFTSISIATLATLAAFAVSAEQASAGSRHGIRISFHGGHYGHRHWGFYGAPVYVSAPVVRSCYFVRRGGGLYKVCPVY